MNVETCNKCLFWDSVDDKTGKCRGTFPQTTLVPAQGIGGVGLQLITYWPETTSADRCGSGRDGRIPYAISPNGVDSSILVKN